MVVQGSVSCAAQVDAEAAEPVHDGVGVKWVAGAGSREQTTPGTLTSLPARRAPSPASAGFPAAARSAVKEDRLHNFSILALSLFVLASMCASASAIASFLAF